MTDTETVEPPALASSERYAPLSDCSTRTENGERYVDALAAVFNVPQEIRDRDGHYLEILDPASFNRTVEQRGTNFQVMFNHGKTMYGTPSERYTMPYGVPEVVRPDANGLVTTTRMLPTELGDEVYTGAREGALRGQSFSGKFVGTRKEAGQRGGLATYRRTEVAMTEYGLTPFPYYQDAKVINVRADVAALVAMTSEDAALYVASLSDVARSALLQALTDVLAAPRTDITDPPAPRTVIEEVDTPTPFTGASLRMTELNRLDDIFRKVLT
jgi:HK97 family phage prohead protease